MKYSEKLIDFEIGNPIQLIVMIMFSIVSAPGRLMSEIAKKVILLGKYSTKFFLASIILNTIIFCLNAAYMLFVDKKINLVFGKMSIASMAVSILLCIVLFIIFSRFMVDYNEEDDSGSSIIPEGNLNYSYERADSPDVDEIGDRDMETLVREMSNLEGSTITESLEDSKIKNLSEGDLETIFREIPKSKIDPIYAHDRESRMNKMAEMLKQCDERSDITEKELEFLKQPSKPSDFVSGLTLDSINEPEDEGKLEEVIRKSRSKESATEIDNCFFDDVLNN